MRGEGGGESDQHDKGGQRTTPPSRGVCHRPRRRKLSNRCCPLRATLGPPPVTNTTMTKQKEALLLDLNHARPHPSAAGEATLKAPLWGKMVEEDAERKSTKRLPSSASPAPHKSCIVGRSLTPRGARWAAQHLLPRPLTHQ